MINKILSNLLYEVNELEKEYSEEAGNIAFDRREGRNEVIERIKIIIGKYSSSEIIINNT